MKYCPKDKSHKNPDNAEFCNVCGARLISSTVSTTNSDVKKCPACNSVNPKEATFCHNCGHSLVPPTPRPKPKPKPKPTPTSSSQPQSDSVPDSDGGLQLLVILIILTIIFYLFDVWILFAICLFITIGGILSEFPKIVYWFKNL